MANMKITLHMEISHKTWLPKVQFTIFVAQVGFSFIPNHKKVQVSQQHTSGY